MDAVSSGKLYQMAKKAKSSITDNLVKVTDVNRKFSLKEGREMIVIKDEKVLGKYDLRPRLLKGWMKINGKSVSITEDESRDDYNLKSLNDHWIKLGYLFFDPQKELIKYELPKTK